MSLKTISLAKFLSGDFSTYYSLVQEDSVMRYITGKGLTPEEARKKFDSMIDINTRNAKIGYFKVYSNDGNFIGDAKLEWDKRDSSQLEIGYILKEAYWGKGYGTMICEKLLSLADELFSTVDIIGIIDPDNAASKRLLEKFGFKSYFIGVEDNLPTEKLILKRRDR